MIVDTMGSYKADGDLIFYIRVTDKKCFRKLNLFKPECMENNLVK